MNKHTGEIHKTQVFSSISTQDCCHLTVNMAFVAMEALHYVALMPKNATILDHMLTTSHRKISYTIPSTERRKKKKPLAQSFGFWKISDKKCNTYMSKTFHCVLLLKKNLHLNQELERTSRTMFGAYITNHVLSIHHEPCLEHTSQTICVAYITDHVQSIDHELCSQPNIWLKNIKKI